MSQSLRSWLLMALMLWQTLAWVTPFVIEAKAELIAHMTVHQQESDHHHHDDASLHLTSDADHPPHFHADDGFQPAGLDVVVAMSVVGASSQKASSARPTPPPAVFLEGLLRPPSPIG